MPRSRQTSRSGEAKQREGAAVEGTTEDTTANLSPRVKEAFTWQPRPNEANAVGSESSSAMAVLTAGLAEANAVSTEITMANARLEEPVTQAIDKPVEAAVDMRAADIPDAMHGKFSPNSAKMKILEVVGMAKATGQQLISRTCVQASGTFALAKAKTTDAAVFATTTRTGVTSSTAAAGAVLCGTTGGAVGTAAGTVAGGAVGGAAGAALGVIPAFFTFGASIPIFAAFGLCLGATTGGTVGAVSGATAGSAAGTAGGAAVGYAGFTYQDKIIDKSHSAKNKVNSSVLQFVNSVKMLIGGSSMRARASMDVTKETVADVVERAKALVGRVANYSQVRCSETIAYTKDKAHGMWSKAHNSKDYVKIAASNSVAQAKYSVERLIGGGTGGTH